MSLKKVVRRSSLDECTREYLEMGMDLTNKRNRYFSFHEKAVNRNYRTKDRPISIDLTETDIVDDVDGRSTTETTLDGTCKSSSNQLSVNNYKEMVKQCLLDSAKEYTNGFQLLRDIESGTTNCNTLNRYPQQLKNIILLWACFVNRCDVVGTLVNSGTNVNYVLRGYGALHISALNGCVSCLRWLLNNGCEPNVHVEDMTALHFATFTDSADVVCTLVEHGCRLEPTVLHSAIKSRAVSCIELLLFKYKIDMNVLDPMGSAAIHICADQGFSDCMHLLLSDKRTLTDLKDHHESTALHLACESAHVECAKLLIEHNANIHAKNMKLQVPMHMAAIAQSVDCIDLLIKSGANVNAPDIDDRTPLHSAISVKTLHVCQTVDTLLYYQAKVNVQDHYGFTPLHIAALNEAPDCVESLLAKGGNVGIQTFGGISVLNMIVRKVPSCMPAVAKQLDSAITSNWADGFKRGPEIQLRFKYLLNCNTYGEIDLLKCFQEEGQYELLQHPLCQGFLFLKWRKLRKYYLMRLVSLGLFIIFYSLYVITVLSHNCYNASHSVNKISNSTCVQHNSTLGIFLMQNSQVMDFIICTLYIVTVIEGIFKISEMAGYMNVHQYLLSLSNISEWLVLISVPFISFHISDKTHNWQNFIGAFCVLCAWTNLMLQIGQLPWFDTYVAMYTKVQKEFAKLLMAYICLLIGFAISLSVVFPSSKWFNNPFTGLVKVLVMMAGELDISMLEIHDESPIMSKLSAYTVYVAILVFVSVILMNLLVGIAVHDIQGLQKTAGLSKIRCQIKLIYYIEMFMLRSFWPKRVKRMALVYPSKSRANMTVRPLNQKQTLPRDIINAVRMLIKLKKSDDCVDNGTLQMQEILKEIRDLRTTVEENQSIIKQLLLINTNKM